MRACIEKAEAKLKAAVYGHEEPKDETLAVPLRVQTVHGLADRSSAHQLAQLRTAKLRRGWPRSFPSRRRGMGVSWRR